MIELQQTLFQESPEEALRALVDALGGPKAIASELLKNKRLEEGRRLVLHWCDEARPEKPSLNELLWLMKEGRQTNCHVFATYLLRETGYADAQPIEPEDERARLMRDYVSAAKSLEQISKRMERVVAMPESSAGRR